MVRHKCILAPLAFAHLLSSLINSAQAAGSAAANEKYNNASTASHSDGVATPLAAIPAGANGIFNATVAASSTTQAVSNALQFTNATFGMKPLRTRGGTKKVLNLSTEEAVGIGAGAGTVVLILIMVATAFCCRYYGAKSLGKAIQTGIETMDRHYLGVDVVFDSIVVDAAQGMVEVVGVKVDNPPGYNHSHLAKIGRVCLDLGMMDTLKSRGKKVVVDLAELREVDIIFETSFSTSNLQDVIDHLNGAHPDQMPDGPEKQEAIKKRNLGVRSILGWCTACTRSPTPGPPPPGPPPPEPAAELRPQQSPRDFARRSPVEQKPPKVMMVKEVKAEVVDPLKVPEQEAGMPMPSPKPAGPKPDGERDGYNKIPDKVQMHADGEPRAKPADHDDVEVVLHKLALCDINVKVAVAQFGGAGHYTSIADIEIDDVEQQKKDMDASGGVAQVLNIVLNSIKKSLVANVHGIEAAHKVH